MKSYKNMLVETRLKDMVEVKTNMKDADFWITRRGSLTTVGKPVKEFNKEHIGVKVTRDDILNPDFLYYAILNMYNEGYFKQYAKGNLSLVNITTQHVKDIRM